jgi:hypothetical protein
MKQLIISITLVLLIMGISFSCKKTKLTEELIQQKPPVTLDSMLQCSGQRSWDSTSIHDYLIGKWQWEFISCYYNTENANGEDYKNLSIEFKQNDSLEVKVNNQITQVSSWYVTRLNDGYFKLTVNPIVYQLPGKVIICDNRVLFYDSYTDGCDNYFKKQY